MPHPAARRQRMMAQRSLRKEGSSARNAAEAIARQRMARRRDRVVGRPVPPSRFRPIKGALPVKPGGPRYGHNPPGPRFTPIGKVRPGGPRPITGRPVPKRRAGPPKPPNPAGMPQPDWFLRRVRQYKAGQRRPIKRNRPVRRPGVLR